MNVAKTAPELESAALSTPNAPLLHCWVEGQGNHWMAGCLEFSLAAEGPSYDEARDNLRAAIRQYVQHACELPDERERDARLSRRAAPAALLLFSLRSLWASWFPRRADATGNRRDAFTLSSTD